jgi:hypothetical protein
MVLFDTFIELPTCEAIITAVLVTWSSCRLYTVWLVAVAVWLCCLVVRWGSQIVQHVFGWTLRQSEFRLRYLQWQYCCCCAGVQPAVNTLRYATSQNIWERSRRSGRRLLPSHNGMQNVIINSLKKVTCCQQCSEDQTHLHAEFTGLA